MLSKKCCIKSGENENETLVPFLYGQHNRIWYYLLTTSVKEIPSLPKVIHHLNSTRLANVHISTEGLILNVSGVSFDLIYFYPLGYTLYCCSCDKGAVSIA